MKSNSFTETSPLDAPKVQIDSILFGAWNALRSDAGQKGVAIKLHFDPEVTSIPGDSSCLQEVFRNLLSNAVKFTPDGGCVDVYVPRTAHYAEVAGPTFTVRLPLLVPSMREARSFS